ncbi:hypothetical protein M569_14334 [Genlisea aurea]|uniref:Uncharacterized protein n=1 Tax=Genlisea aurea TaxID=192259 RepID=S8DCE3_9LAMI|nr:hypothetical protein M569_14334 [Genlisea aurea]
MNERTRRQGGIILGPSVLGRSAKFADTIFPLRSVVVLETMANLGLLYYLFLIGLEMDVAVVKRTGRKAVLIAISGMFLPFLIGVSFAFMLHSSTEYVKLGTFILFLGMVLAVTAFPVLARVLADLKLINTEIGRIALSSALVNDVCAWVLLGFGIALAENDDTSLASLWVILASVAFVVFCFCVVKPLISWVVRTTPEGESVNELYVCLILSAVMLAGFITDAIGMNSVLGSFVLGLIIPHGTLGITLIERLEDFVSGLMMPLFFTMSGLKTDIFAINGAWTWVCLLTVIVLASIGKIAGTLLVSLYYKMPFYEGLTLGLLMNTKGLVEMIVLNVGRDQKVLDTESFSIMVVAALVMTSIISPIVMTIYKPSRRYAPYKRRTMQRTKQEGEFRILVCVHTPRNVPTMINLLEASYPNRRSPILVCVLHLVELTGRNSSMLIVHNTGKNDGIGGGNGSRSQAQSDHIVNAFENFQQHAGFVSVDPLTAVSPYSTIHEDICSVAEDKRVAFIIVPFHKQQTVDGGMESTNPAYRAINQNVMAAAPCSVGILVDRGLGGAGRMAAVTPGTHHVAVLFFGGADDREALAYGWRMSEHPGINLTVMRFLCGRSTTEATVAGERNIQSGLGMLSRPTETDRERDLDEDYINQFRARTMMDSSISYSESVVNHGEETVAAIRSIDAIHDLFIVGRGQGLESPLTAGLTDWSECPELGPIGDLLASSDFASTYSVLVVQQYIGVETHGGWAGGQPESPPMASAQPAVFQPQP